ncbi:MAG: hypothetical protein ABI867_10085 [Kofleriaceae bacterium]
MIERAIRSIRKVPHIGPLLSSWQGWVIVVVLASQAVLPLHYYLARRDPHDERFAWRMFSPMRMTSCALEMKVDGKRLELGSEFHEAWIEIAKRGRFEVIEAMGARMCHKKPGSAVTIRLECTYIDRPEPHIYGGFNLCDAPKI